MRLDPFLRDRSGLAALEFALIFPMMLLLFCGVVELVNLYNLDRKVVMATQSCADLITQEKTISDSKLNDIGRAVELVLDPFPGTGLSFRVTSVNFDPINGAPSVGWQKTYGGFAGGGPAPTASAANLGLPGESVVIVNLSYTYRPVFQNILPSSFPITELAAARPRRVRVITCTAAGC
jgi:Flp pilus assembly protein TadG